MDDNAADAPHAAVATDAASDSGSDEASDEASASPASESPPHMQLHAQPHPHPHPQPQPHPHPQPQPHPQPWISRSRSSSRASSSHVVVTAPARAESSIVCIPCSPSVSFCRPHRSRSTCRHRTLARSARKSSRFRTRSARRRGFPQAMGRRCSVGKPGATTKRGRASLTPVRERARMELEEKRTIANEVQVLWGKDCWESSTGKIEGGGRRRDLGLSPSAASCIG